MATRTTVQIVDDLTDEIVPDDLPVTKERFVVGGWAYELDLGPDGQKRFEAAFEGLVDKARKLRRMAIRVDEDGSTSARQPATIDKEQNQAIRVWARGQGLKVSDRGRIPASVVDAFNEEH